MVNLTKDDLESLSKIVLEALQPLHEGVDSLSVAIDSFRKEIAALDDRVSALEKKFDEKDRLLMILVSESVREQIRKDDLYPFVTNEQKVETAVSRILERQNGLGEMILRCLAKQ